MSTNKRSMSNDSKLDAAGHARSYPRKRVSIACEVCRLRKTRCDAAKPACSFCSELGIECVYKRPADASRPDARSEELTHALRRLDQIELTLESIASVVGAQDRRHSQCQSIPEVSPFISTPLAFRNDPITPSPASLSTTAANSSKRRYACKMPNLLSFRHPLPEHSDWSWNCTEYFFNDQMDAIADMRQHLNLPVPDPDLSEPHLGNLQRSFADHILKWLPLFDPETASRHLRYARSTEYRNPNSTCIVYLIFANGAISSDTALYSRSAHELPGFAYYARAVAVLDRLPATSRDLTALQCRVLVAIYLLFAMRPLEAWKHITQASQECILLLRANANHDASTEYREAFRRIYWICYVLENELEACLEVPSSGIRTYEYMVPRPSSQYDEEGMYFLLALSSLRKVMVEVLDTVGYKSASGYVAYNPVVALELRTQIDDWYRHLPAPLRFTLDGNMLFDTRKAYLRCSYYALLVVATWPFLIPLSQAPIRTPQDTSQHLPPHLPTCPTSHPSQESIPTLYAQPQNQADGRPPTPASAQPLHDVEPPTHTDPSHRAAAHACLEACRFYLTHAEEILTSKSLVSHLIVRQYYAFTMILLLSFSGVDLQDGGSLDERRYLEAAIRNLKYWHVVPFMGESLHNMRRIGELRGLRLGI